MLPVESLRTLVPPLLKKSICKPFLKDLTFTDMEISCDLWEMEIHKKRKEKRKIKMKEKREKEMWRGGGGKRVQTSASSSITGQRSWERRRTGCHCVSIKTVTN